MTEQKPRKKTRDQVEADADEARQSAGRTRLFPTIPLPAGVDMSRSTEPARAGTIMVEVPFVASTKYAQREVYLALPAAQAATLRSVQEALEERHAKLSNGRVVQSPQDGLKWLLEEVERARVK